MSDTVYLRAYRVHQTSLPTITSIFNVVQVLEQDDRTAVVIIEIDTNYVQQQHRLKDHILD